MTTTATRWTRLPAIALLADMILREWQALHREAGPVVEGEDDDDAFCDVRVHALTSDRVAFAGGSDVRFGDAHMDRMHGDAIGAGEIDIRATPSRAAADRIARAVLADARDQMAQVA